jgi:2-oxoglutarate dehydrogenase E1 component
MGFEYGYSVDMLDSLTIWEAQFGDFANAGQVIIDQFIASAEDKWKYLSGLTLLLPHSFEGMGPEHSSARLERFLALGADDNIQICNVTTPAQIFHLLRRQVLRNWRKPLVVMSPKSLLRHPDAVSSLDELASGGFRNILSDTTTDPQKVKHILLCTGKIYFELAHSRQEMKRDDVAILRLEQLYPLSDKWLKDELAVYAPGTPVTWVQEEPENMGAWRHLLVRFGYEMFGSYPLSCVSRPASPSPATGSAKVHKLEQMALIEQAFGSELPSHGEGLALTAITKGFAS